MKKINLLFLALVMMFLAACEKNQSSSFDDFDSADLKTSLRNLDKDILKAEMQMTSFVISGMLIEDNDLLFRDQFQLISETGGTIALSELFEDQEFEDHFIELIEFYYSDDYDDGSDNATRPKNKPARPPSGVHTNQDFLLVYTINSIKNNDCIEVHLPNVLVFDEEPIEIISTAHPLSNSNRNEAFSNQLIFNNGVEVLDGDVFQINEGFVGREVNIISIRPISSSSNSFYLSDPTCDYSDFEVDDFTEFLSGE